MFKSTSFSPYTGKIKTLELKSNPIWNGPGEYKDIYGNLWKIASVHGQASNLENSYVTARLILSTESTSLEQKSGFTHERFIPYYVKLIKENEINNRKN